MKKKIFAIIFSIFLSSIIYHLGSVHINAQQVSLSLSPPLIELFIKPGKSVTVTYDLKNYGDPTFLNLKVLPFEAKDNLGNIRIKPEFEGPVRFNLDNNDLKLGQPFFLKTNSSQQILLQIRIPENISGGDYYYSLLAEADPPTSSEGVGSARTRTTIGSNILITISNSGAVDIKPKISIFSTLGGYKIGQNVRVFDSLDKIPVILTVVNSGNNLIKPEGQIILKGNFGETAKYDIIQKNILAHSEKKLETKILSGFFIGKYNLSTVIRFGENSPTIFGSTVFYAFPFKILGGILISCLLILSILKKRKDDV